MNPAEYATMRAVEDGHWWYRALRGLIQDALARIPLASNARVLDVGCGTGANLAELPRAGVGVDLAREALRYSRDRGLTSLAQADAAELPFPDSRFDAALLADVLYHKAVPDKAAVLREIRRVLKPGGLLILNVPAYQWLYSAHDVAIHTERRFTRREVRRLLRQSGYAVCTLTHWNAALLPAVCAIRFADRLRAAPNNGSDLNRYRPGHADRIPAGLLQLERYWLRRFPLPAGVSIFAVAQKPAP